MLISCVLLKISNNVGAHCSGECCNCLEKGYHISVTGKRTEIVAVVFKKSTLHCYFASSFLNSMGMKFRGKHSLHMFFIVLKLFRICVLNFFLDMQN